MSEPIVFYYRGEQQRITQASPNRTLLQYLREDLHCTGSKEGCAEGDCGACTVVVGELENGQLQMKSVNACIQLLPSMHGKALFTVEDLGPACKNTGCATDCDLHPVQAAMVNCHASQCGFCTPGFVMSLWDLYLRHEQLGAPPSRQEIATALSGNLCRCTGYRPIIDAAQEMFKLPRVAFERALVEQQLRQLQPDGSHAAPHYDYAAQSFFWPQNLSQALQLRAQHPQATLLAGGTDIGLWITKQMRQLNSLIYLGQVEELLQMREHNGMLEIGAAVNLNQAYSKICQYYGQALYEMWQRFASMPVRNAGTLGGNVANGSPIGDSMPWLIALGAQVKLQSVRGTRQMPLEDFYLAYQKKDMQLDEIVSHVLLPLPKPHWLFRTYKLAKRFDQDISAVCAAFALEIVDGIIINARIAFGGMAATPKRASHTEQILLGAHWDELNLDIAKASLMQDYQPLSDMRASSKYRMKTAQNLLHRFWLETRADQPLSATDVNAFAYADADADTFFAKAEGV